MKTDRIHMLLPVTAAVLLLAGSAMLQGPLGRISGEHEQLALRDRIARENPEYLILTIAPGGLRAPFVAYLWIRAEELKDQGRFYDAKQNADLICMFQPRFAGAWAFNAWNMAYNISVATHTPQERWNWVSNGYKLLRDKGISYNPKALNLYKELSWIFFHKIGGSTDDMHLYYKQRLAGEMQRLLPTPSYGTTREVVAAFRPIAEAPLDKVAVARVLPLPWLALVASMLAGIAGLSILAIPRLHGPAGLTAAAVLLIAGAGIFAVSLYTQSSGTQEGDQSAGAQAIDRLLADPNGSTTKTVARYVDLLAAEGVSLDWSLLDAYNKFSTDGNLQATRVSMPNPETPAERSLSDLINTDDAGLATARDKILAFVRAKILWSEYKMDPEWMLGLMVKYGPLDWRLPQAHSLYWATYGLYVCEGTSLDSLDQIDYLNTTRHMLNSIKDLTWGGRLTYTANPNDPKAPLVETFFDARYVHPMRELYDSLRRRAEKERPHLDVKDNVFRSGHINYLIAVMQMLYPMYEREMAQEIYDYIKDTYDMDTDEWVLPLKEFLWHRRRVDGAPIRRYAMSQISAAIRAGYIARLYGRGKAYRESFKYAQEVWSTSLDKTKGFKLPPLEVMQTQELGALIIRPKIVGYVLSVQQRSRLYTDPHVTVQMRRALYDPIQANLRRECDAKGIDFDKAFPEPRGMKPFRDLRRRMQDPKGQL